MPKQINFEGTTHTFPDDFSDQDIQAALNKFSLAHAQQIPRINAQPQQMVPGGNFGQELSNMIPAATATVGELAAGPPGGILGGIGGSLLKQAVQPNEPSAGQFAVDAAANTALPWAVSKLPFVKQIAGRMLGKLASSTNPTIEAWIRDKAGTFLGSQAETAAKIGGDVKDAMSVERPGFTERVPVYNDIADKVPAGFKVQPTEETSKSVLGDFSEIPSLQMKTENQSIQKTVDKAFSDVTQIRNLKMVANPADVEQLGLNRAIHSGFDGTKIDPDKILGELNGASKDIYDEAISPAAKGRLEDFLGEVKKLQPPTEKGVVPGMINYARRRLVFDVTAALGAHALGGGIAGTGAGIVLSEGILSKFASSELAGKLAIESLRTPVASPAAQLISKALLYSMRGSSVLLQLPDGKTEKAQVDQNGQLTLPNPVSQSIRLTP